MAIRVHRYYNPQRDTEKMMIHTYKNGVLESSSKDMPYCIKTIKLYSRGHKVVEQVNVAKAADLPVRELLFKDN